MIGMRREINNNKISIIRIRILWLLLLLLVIRVSTQTQPKKRICIIGGGLSGLVSAKQLAENLNNVEPIVFEKATNIGGQWKYTDSTNVDEHGLPVHSSIYKNLRTNGPKVLMSFPDYQEFHGENRSYVRHETVLEYLTNFTEHFNLRQYIKLNTLVEKVSWMSDKRWLMKTRNLNNDKSKDYICDAVMVCNGPHMKPHVPIIPGIDTFPGRTFHSHFYRKPEEFTNKTVVILGASFSGMDIGIELSKYAKTIYLSHRHSRITIELPKNIIQIPGVVAANGSDLILNEGSRVRADVFIMCTGYLLDFPFLDESSGITVPKGKFAYPLYKQFININHPTMVFVGYPQPDFPFYIPYVQLQYFIALLRGKAKLPSREVMFQDAQAPTEPSNNNGSYVDIKHFAEVLDYYDDLAKTAGSELLSESLRKAALIYLQDLASDVLHFKDHEIIIRDDGRVELIKPNKYQD